MRLKEIAAATAFMTIISYCCIALVYHPMANAQSSFGGYRCTKDCSGHKAGYDWAKKKNVRDPKDCASKSQSFAEGCLVFVKEKNRGK